MNALVPHANATASPVVRAWLVKLHELTAGISTTQDALDRMERVLDQFEVGRYSDGSFTRRSLEHVASRSRFWPSYGELCTALDGWLAQDQPPMLNRAAPSEGLSAADQSWVNFYHRRVEEIGQATSFRWGSRGAEIEKLGSLVRQNSPRAWKAVSSESVVIQDRPSDYQIGSVARALRMPGGPLAGVPAPEEAEQARQPRPAYLTGEALQRSRRARGLNIPEPGP